MRSCAGSKSSGPWDSFAANCKSFLTAHQHTPFDLAQFVTPSYAARIAQVMAGTAASLASAPGAPQKFTAIGNAVRGVTVNFRGPQNDNVDHFVVAARSVNENFYRQRVIISEGDNNLISPQTLGLNPGDSFFISVATVDDLGYESLFAYPEVRCDSSSCAVPANAQAAAASVPAAQRPAMEDIDQE